MLQPISQSPFVFSQQITGFKRFINIKYEEIFSRTITEFLETVARCAILRARLNVFEYRDFEKVKKRDFRSILVVDLLGPHLYAKLVDLDQCFPGIIKTFFSIAIFLQKQDTHISDVDSAGSYDYIATSRVPPSYDPSRHTKGVVITTTTTDNTTNLTYSKKLSATQKLLKQLIFAMLQQAQEQKENPVQKVFFLLGKLGLSVDILISKELTQLILDLPKNTEEIWQKFEALLTSEGLHRDQVLYILETSRAVTSRRLDPRCILLSPKKRSISTGFFTLCSLETIRNFPLSVASYIIKRNCAKEVVFAHNLNICLTNGKIVIGYLLTMCSGNNDRDCCNAFIFKELPDLISGGLSDRQHLTPTIVTNAIVEAIHFLNISYQKTKPDETAGSTIIGTVLLENTFYFFNIGDSRAIACVPLIDGKLTALRMTEDQLSQNERINPKLPTSDFLYLERRVLVRGRLCNVSRCLGIKEIFCRPKITFFKGSGLFVIASYAFWNAVSDRQAAHIANELKTETPEVIAKALIDFAKQNLEIISTEHVVEDDITVVVLNAFRRRAGTP